MLLTLGGSQRSFVVMIAVHQVGRVQMSESIDFIVRRDDLRTCKCVGDVSDTELEPGQVQLRVEKFAVTANNVSYAVYGESIGYWGFFPTDHEGWGRVPAWGFAVVERSANEQVSVGERFYGFLPMSSIVTMDAKANSAGFRDIAAHRLTLPSAYNSYTSTLKDPVYDASHEDEQMILRPLFITSFLAHDYLVHEKLFGADTVIVSSASSKTAYGLAFLLSRDPRLRVIGLTSDRNEKFTQGLGCYSEVSTYDQISAIGMDNSVVFVDVAGSVPVREAVTRTAGSNLVYAMALGDTHWESDKPRASLTGTEEFFFAPTWLKKRTQEWGTSGYVARVAEAWHSFSGPLSSWIDVKRERGGDALEHLWLKHLEGSADPSRGNVVSLN